MKTESIEEFLKRGGKVKKLETVEENITLRESKYQSKDIYGETTIYQYNRKGKSVPAIRKDEAAYEPALAFMKRK